MTIKIGDINPVIVTDTYPFGYMVQVEGSDEPIALPSANVATKPQIGDQLSAFIYLSEDGSLVATGKQPKVKVGEVAVLKAVGATDFAAFFDWGMERDLMVPQAQQDAPVSEGMNYVVYAYYDDATHRLLGTTRLHYHFSETNHQLEEGQAVSILVYAETDLGYKVLINESSLGLVFKSDAFKPLRVGDSSPAFIAKIRPDGKVDVTLQQDNHQGRDALQQAILDDLEAHGGISTLTDKSPADEIYSHFNVSKGAYKKALGALYKQRKILLSKNAVKLAKPEQ